MLSGMCSKGPGKAMGSPRSQKEAFEAGVPGVGDEVNTHQFDLRLSGLPIA